MNGNDSDWICMSLFIETMFPFFVVRNFVLIIIKKEHGNTNLLSF